MDTWTQPSIKLWRTGQKGYALWKPNETFFVVNPPKAGWLYGRPGCKPVVECKPVGREEIVLELKEGSDNYDYRCPLLVLD